MMRSTTVLLALGFAALAASPTFADDKELAITKDYPLEQVSERVYVIFGANELPTAENKAFHNNPGIVLTDSGIVIFDPGASVHTGRYVMERARELDPSRVVAVFNSHSHGNHWLGNQAIKEAYPNAVIYAHPRTKQLARQGEGQRWIKALNRRTGGALKGTYPVGPDKAVRDGEVIEIGGVRFRIHHTGPAHTRSDIMVEVVEEEVLFFGDVVRSHDISQFMTSLKGNLEAIDAGLDTGATRFVPGHGPGLDRAMVGTYREFLATLRSRLKALYDEGVSLHEVKRPTIKTLDGYRSWTGFEQNIGRLISIGYQEVEQEAFGVL